MQQMQALLETLLVFLIIIMIGYILRTKNKVNPNLQNDLGFILMNVALPFMMFSAIAQPFDRALLQQGLKACGFIVVYFLLGSTVGFISMKIFHVKPSQRGIWMLQATFSNIGFMGYPVIYAIFGNDGLFIASFATIAFNIIYYPVGIMMVRGRKEKEPFDLKSAFMNNMMLFTLIGLIFFFAKIQVSGFVAKTASTIGGLTGPLAMLVIGLKLGEFPLKDIFNSEKQYQICFVRLLLVPAATVLFFKFLHIIDNPLVLAVLVVISALPMPANSTVIANQYGGDSEFAAKSTTLSSILCIITIPIILLLL